MATTYPDVVRGNVAAGHTVGTHSQNHPPMAPQGAARMRYWHLPNLRLAKHRPALRQSNLQVISVMRTPRVRAGTCQRL